MRSNQLFIFLFLHLKILSLNIEIFIIHIHFLELFSHLFNLQNINKRHIQSYLSPQSFSCTVLTTMDYFQLLFAAKPYPWRQPKSALGIHLFPFSFTGLSATKTKSHSFPSNT